MRDYISKAAQCKVLRYYVLELIYFTGDINENIEPQLLFQHGLLNRWEGRIL